MQISKLLLCMKQAKVSVQGNPTGPGRCCSSHARCRAMVIPNWCQQAGYDIPRRIRFCEWHGVMHQNQQLGIIIGQHFVQDGNLVIFGKQISLCNLVTAQVVHRSDGMINSGHFQTVFFIHHGPRLPVMGLNGCPMNRLLYNFVWGHDV